MGNISGLDYYCVSQVSLAWSGKILLSLNVSVLPVKVAMDLTGAGVAKGVHNVSTVYRSTMTSFLYRILGLHMTS